MQVVKSEKDDDDSEDRLEPGSRRENLEYVDDDDDDDEEKVDEEKDVNKGSLETRTGEMQTLIPTPLRSLRINLSSDKNITQELTDIVPLPTETTSKTSHSKRRISSKYSHIPVDRVLHEIVPQLAEKATHDLIENNLKPSIAATIIEDRDAFHSEVPDLVSQEFKGQALKIIKELFKNYVQSNVIQVHHTITTSTETTSSTDLQPQLHLKMKRSLQDQANDPVLHDDHQEDDAPPEGEKRVKRHKASKSSKSARGSLSKHSAKDSTTYVSKQQQQQQEWDAWVEETVLDEYEVIPKVETPELITKLQNIDKHNGNTDEKKYILSLRKIHAERFPEVDLEERMNRWVRKEFKNFNEDVRLTIQHWKDSWHKRVYKQNQRRVRKNSEDYFSDHRIIEVVRITTDQPHGLDFISHVIWERVHDFQLGIESYQVKVNLTVPTLTFPGIEAYEPYLIVDKPNTGLIYLDNKDEKRVMYLVEIVKFCDATLEKVLKEVKLKIF
ncbi:hypothetical protein Tco_0178766 [Tanacetum coccineum]